MKDEKLNECDYEEVELLIFDGDNGEKEEFVIVAELEIADKAYVVLSPLEVYKTATDILGAIIMGTEKNKNGENLYFNIEDWEEWKMVASAAEQLYTEPILAN